MDLLTFITDIVQVLAWPVAIVVSSMILARALRARFEDHER